MIWDDLSRHGTPKHFPRALLNAGVGGRQKTRFFTDTRGATQPEAAALSGDADPKNRSRPRKADCKPLERNWAVKPPDRARFYRKKKTRKKRASPPVKSVNGRLLAKRRYGCSPRHSWGSKDHGQRQTSYES
jgi:hypothetical protein